MKNKFILGLVFGIFLVVLSLVFSVSAQNYSNNTTSSNQTNITLPGNQTGNLTLNQTNITLPGNQTNLTVVIWNITNFTLPGNQTNYTAIFNVSNLTISIGNYSGINISITQNVSNFTSVNISIEKAILKANYVEQVKGITLDKESGKLIYFVYGIREGRLLAVIPVSAKVNQKIDANSGAVISTEKPWWSFLATKI